MRTIAVCRLRLAGVACSTIVRDARRERIVATILDEAKAFNVSLIVLGTRGRSGVRATLFGSVSQAVSANAACPTVIVHAAAHC